MTLIQRMLDIKTKYNALKVPKTKVALENYYDKKIALRREMSDLVELHQNEIAVMVTKHAKSLTIMSPSGGPIHIKEGCNVVMFQNHGTYLQLTIDNEWVGLVYLMQNQCGMDNVLILSKLAV